MTRDEAMRVMAQYTAAWPRVDLSEATARVWMDQLRDVNFEACSEALRDLIGHEKFPPAIAEVRLAAREVAKRRPVSPRAELAPAEPPVDREQAKRWIAEIRAGLKNIGRRV